MIDLASTALVSPLLGQQAVAKTAGMSPQEMKKLKETAQQFEAMFVSEMLNHMNQDVEVNPMFGGGKGEEMFRSMLNQEYGKVAAQSGNGIGLATHIQKAMVDMQAAADHR